MRLRFRAWQSKKATGLNDTARLRIFIPSGHLSSYLFSFLQPAGAKNGPTLRSTGKADALKTGNLARPITNIRDVVENEEKNLDFQKPEWTQEVAGKERNLHDPAKPITAAPHADESKSTLGWKKPDCKYLSIASQ